VHEEIFAITGDKLIDGAINVLWKKGHNTGAVFMYRELSETDAHYHPAVTYYSSPSPLPIPRHEHIRDVFIVGRYLKGNQQVGEWSEPHRLTIPAAAPQAI
jgi:hypothetical protein